MSRLVVFVGWVVLPLIILLIGEIAFIARIAFWTAVVKLGWETIKIYGNPQKWIPSYGRYKKRIEAEELRKRHFIYHCERNPEGFERLKAENFAQEKKRTT